MEALGVAASAIAVIQLIAVTSKTISSFIRGVRESRSDLDEIERELQSIGRILELLGEDIESQPPGNPQPTIPDSLEQQILGILKCCSIAIGEVEQTLEKCRAEMGKSIGYQFRWAVVGKAEIKRLRAVLEPNRRALEIAVDVMTWTITRDIKKDTSLIIEDTTVLKHNTDRILEEMDKLQRLLPLNMEPQHLRLLDCDQGYLLDKYLESLTTFTESNQAPDPDDLAITFPTTDSVTLRDHDTRNDAQLPYRLKVEAQAQDPEATLRSTLRNMGFTDHSQSLPPSFLAALQNRLTTQHLERSLKLAMRFGQESLPLFAVGAFIFPSSITSIVGDMTLRHAIASMTPGILRGYRRHAVISAPWPALFPSTDRTDEVHGMMIFGMTGTHRESLHSFQGGLFDLNRATVEVQSQDGLIFHHEAMVYVWNGRSSDLIPVDSKKWSASEMLKSQWLTQVRSEAESEELQSS